ncbi:MAG: hypothetical protein HKO57_05655, partial [Akkermansiaceae bacterium]|nr:hypothetical protein [Akkermansiaceae bacterium]
MPAGIDPQRLHAFQLRMARWVASQGLLFQVRHALGVRGAGTSFLAGILSLFGRLLILGVLCAGAFWLFLMKRVEFGWFRTDLSENVAEAVNADVASFGGLRTERGSLVIGKAALEGGADSFFERAELRSARTKMQLLDGVTRGWNGEEINVEQLKIRVKAGADSDEAAARAFGALFFDTGQYRFARMKVESAHVDWGYSEANRGSIVDSKMVVEPDGDGWKVVFTGGTFSQNWLQRLGIERLEVAIRREGVEITEARLTKGSGTVQFSAKIGGGAVPAVEGAGTFASLRIEDFIDSDFRTYLGGDLSGDFKIGGSTNSQEGVALDCSIVLAEGDTIELYDRISLFRAISAVDRLRSYKKVRLTRGTFHLATAGGTMRINDIALESPSVLRLEGDLLVRPPTEEEVAAMMDAEAPDSIGLARPVPDRDNGGGGGPDGAGPRETTVDGNITPGEYQGGLDAMENE